MKDIVFVFCEGCYPVPAIKGGAVEYLTQMLLDQNEIHHKYNFHVIMCKSFDDKTVYDYSKYKNTKFYDFYQSNFKFKLDKYINAVNKRLNYSLPLKSKYENFIIQTILKINPDFIIFEGSFNASVRFLTKNFGKEKMILHVHHQIALKKHIDKYFGNMLCVSNFIKNDWIESKKLSNNFNYIVLPVALKERFVDEGQIELIKKQYNIKKDDYIVAFCGRLIKEKGVDILIKAINNLNNRKIKLLIIGGSEFKGSKQTPYIKYLQGLVNGRNNIIFTGYIDNDKLFNYYMVADLLVVPSICNESANLVSLEGRKLGLREIVTRSGGMPEYCSKSAKILDINDDLEKTLTQEILAEYKTGKQQKTPEKVDDEKDYFKNFCKLF